VLLASVGDRLSEGVIEWFDRDPRRRVWASGVVGAFWGTVVYVMLVLLPGVRELAALLFGDAYPVVLAILVIGFGVFLGMVFGRMQHDVSLRSR
jgi:hypothetical protein